MNLTDLQRQAWEAAESKGFHDDLREGLPVSRRHAALYDLALVYEAVTALTQQIKRHGGEDHPTLTHLGHLLTGAVETFCRHHRQLMRYPEEAGVRLMTPTMAATIRLVLLHTEVSEAIAALHDDQAEPGAFAQELADIQIRLGDLAKESGVDLDASTQAVMARNGRRPRKYGTPDAEEEPLGTPHGD